MKIINASDFHFSTEWIDTSKLCGAAVARAAVENGVDLIVTSDWFDRPILATDKGGLKEAKKIMKSWLSVCPVVAVEGTPSHDAPGCYGIFEEMGLVVLRPGVVYGFWNQKEEYADPGRTNFVKKIEINDIRIADAILFGFPELNKNNVQARLGLPAEKANAEAVNLFNQYIEGFVAPMRMKHAGIPAFGILHGNVSDCSKSNETDIILKASDIVIHTEDLEKADFDYWFLGHIHKPWTSEKIHASYPGSWGKTWGETGFLPCFDLFDNGTIKRIQYGTPMRKKVFSTSDIIDRAVAYWLVSDTEELPENCHPWSRHTFEKKESGTRRVSSEDASEVKTLWDLFLLLDPEIDPLLKEKVDSIPDSKNEILSKSINISMKSLMVEGCSGFNGRTVSLDIDSIQDSLTAIIGENGAGKSFLLSFCSPYPFVIGKDTKSGQQSSIKDFFPMGGLIEKKFDVNGDEHVHVITIKNKTEVFISINGRPALERQSFSTAMVFCEETYGPFSDYSLTTFYEQPQQSSSNQSGLMSAKRTDARNVVQNIAGIDRESEKRFALDFMKNLAEKLKDKESKRDLLVEQSGGKEEKEKALYLIEKELREINEQIKTVESTTEEIKHLISEKEKQVAKEEQKKSEKESLEKELHEKGNKLQPLIFEKDSLLKACEKLEENRAMISSDDKIIERILVLEKEKEAVRLANENRASEYSRMMSEYSMKKLQLNAIVSEVENFSYIIDEKHRAIEHLVPCEFCGKLNSGAEERKSALLHDIANLTKQKEQKEEEMKYLPIPEKPCPIHEEPFILESELNELILKKINNREPIVNAIREAEQAESRIREIDPLLSSIQDDVNSLRNRLNGIEIDSGIFEELFSLKGELPIKMSESNLLHQERANLTNKSTRMQSQLETIESIEKDVIMLTEEISSLSKDVSEWTLIQKYLNPDKIPALELDLVLDEIDKNATETIEPFLNGRYSYRTTTQENGVDRFDIIIHDSETGKEFSLFFVNPGNKAFYSDCYVKALIKQRNKKMNISYSPIISDEQDAPISPDRVVMYYEIQRNYFGNRKERVLVVTQKKEVATAYIQNTIKMEDLLS